MNKNQESSRTMNVKNASFIIILNVCCIFLLLVNALDAGELIPGSSLQISAKEFYAKYNVERSIDGDNKTYIAGPIPAEVIIDLGKNTSIDQITLILAPGGKRYYQYTVETSTDKENWSKLIDFSRNTNIATYNGDDHNFKAIIVRYIKINGLFNSILPAFYISEIKIYQCSSLGLADDKKKMEKKKTNSGKPAVNRIPFHQRQDEMLNVDDRLKKYRKLWLEETKGENIALGAKVSFSVNPNYKHATSDNDIGELVDGMLITRKDGKLLFDKKAVVWAGLNLRATGLFIIIDLGKVQPIDKIIVRTLGGKEYPSTFFPKHMTVIVSEDMKNFYTINQISKVLPMDKIAPPGIIRSGLLYLPEEKKSYVFPYVFSELKTKARYIVLLLKVETNVFGSDEIVVIKGKHDVRKVRYNPSQKVYYTIDGVGFYPEKNSFDLAANIRVPNWFKVDDRRSDRKKPLTYVMELPPEIELEESLIWPCKIKKEKVGDLIRWSISHPRVTIYGSYVGPFNFRLLNKKLSSRTAIFYAETEGYRPNKQKVPIRIIDIPKVPVYKNFHIGPGWISHTYIKNWPQFLTSMKHLGFNSIPVFPRRWAGKTEETEILNLIDNARNMGFKVSYMESPFHMMHHVNGKKADAAEIYTVFTDGKKAERNHNKICPSYFGKYYDKEIKRVGDLYELVKADMIFYDIECFQYGSKLAGQCKTCIAEKKRCGAKTDEEFWEYLGTRHAGNLYNEIRKRSKILSKKVSPMGSYAVHASGLHFKEQLFYLNKICPKYFQFGMPNFYVGGDIIKIRNTLKADYSVRKKRANIPWLTAGTYGEFPSERIELMIYETILCGASGFLYFANWNWDTPMDLYYHAVALKNLHPYEDMLFSGGGPVDPVCSNKRLRISAWKNGREIIVLVANYVSKDKENGTIMLPVKNISELKNIRLDKKMAASSTISCSLGYYECALYYAKGD